MVLRNSGKQFELCFNLCYLIISFSFGYRRHGGTSAEGTCRDPFDRQWGTLAHAYYPRDGRLHFDESEHWTVNTNRGCNLLWVAVHEIGHSLGLKHSNVRGTIMWPTYSGYNPNMRLHSDDIRGIQSLYGKGKKHYFVVKTQHVIYSTEKG